MQKSRGSNRHGFLFQGDYGTFQNSYLGLRRTLARRLLSFTVTPIRARSIRAETMRSCCSELRWDQACDCLNCSTRLFCEDMRPDSLLNLLTAEIVAVQVLASLLPQHLSLEIMCVAWEQQTAVPYLDVIFSRTRLHKAAE